MSQEEKSPYGKKVLRGVLSAPSDDGLYNNKLLFEGDIVLRAEGKNAVSNKTLLWPAATVIYKIDSDIGCPGSMQCRILMNAIDHYHRKTCVRFKEWTGEENFVQIFFNSGESGACWSLVGKTGKGAQRLSLGRRCWYLGIVIHELGHAIGFWHEMNRPDRDNWIRIYWDNILPKFMHAFAKYDTKTVDTLGEKFDYKSIMMYDEYAFSKDGKSATLKSLSGTEIGPIWKKPGLSSSDIRRVHKLYSCQGTHPQLGYPFGLNCTFSHDNCGFKYQGMAWKRNNGHMSSTSGLLTSIHLDGNPSAASGCVRFRYLTSLNGSLKLTQSRLEKVTQLTTKPIETKQMWMSQSQPTNWTRIEIKLNVKRPFKLIFESIGSGESSVSLDDVNVLYRSCVA